MPVDLHIHTSLSDSTLSPLEVVQYAHQMGLSAIGVADHDTVDGIEPTIEAAQKYGIEVIPGVELSASISNEEIHILGYYLDWKDQHFREFLQNFCKERKNRVYKIVQKLAGLGIKIDSERVLEVAGRGSVGRLHIAQVLSEQGYVNSIAEAFTKYLKRNGPCYVEKFRLSPEEAVRMILEVRGVPVLGHPWYLDCDYLIRRLLPSGLKGIEVYHPEHTPEKVSFLQDLAKKYNLIITGGSDCHGLNKGAILIGSMTVDDQILERLKETRDEIGSRRVEI